jgi:peptidyl-dipeptidase Dcp
VADKDRVAGAGSQIACYFNNAVDTLGQSELSRWSNRVMKQPLVMRIASSSVISAAVLFAVSAAFSPGAYAKPQAPAAGQSAQYAAFDETNPFAKRSPLPFQAPPFDKIKDSDYQPAIEEGMRRELAEVELIANNPAAPTFENTMEALERRGEMVKRVRSVLEGMVGSNTSPTIQKVESEEAPKLAAQDDAIYLNAKLFARVKAIYDQRKTLKLAADAEYLVERYYRDFVRAGALLSERDKSTMRALNTEQAKLSDEFRNKVLADRNASALVISDRAELAGMSEDDIAAAAEAAGKAGHTGKWVLTLQNTTQQPAQTYLKNRGVREKLFEASSKPCSHGGENDTKAIVERLAQLRAQKAKLLGYPTYAAYVLDDQMAKTPDKAIKLMSDLAPAATSKARGEAARMQDMIDREKRPFKFEAWDWQYYAEQVRKAEYDLDESAIRPYFELNRVLNDGVFYAANQLYGLTFKERKDIPVYQPDVRVYEVFDADGTSLALFYIDFFARGNKQGGAWTSEFMGQSRLLGTKPVVTNTENFVKPAAGQATLLSFREVITMFHEFGHALQGMLSDVRYPNSQIPTDFVEVPSEFNEHWALEPAVFANYAKHYETGQAMPKELVEKIKKSRTFNQGFALTEYLEAALLDMGWHMLPAEAPLQSAETFEPEVLKRYEVLMAEVPPRYHTTYFSHIWEGGYAAGYYAYLWSEVIDDDAFAWFKENGGMTRKNGQRFREMILAPAGSLDAATMYRAFRGRDAVVEPLLEERGLKTPAKAKE